VPTPGSRQPREVPAVGVCPLTVRGTERALDVTFSVTPKGSSRF
jgi:hypothetical protein